MLQTNTHFKAFGYDYQVDQYGVIHQLNPDPFIYDAKYNSTYDTPKYVRGSETLQALRLGFILGKVGPVDSIVDFGAGNGAFCKFSKKYIRCVASYDTYYNPIEGIDTVIGLIPADVYTFHDSLEHVSDLSFLRTLNARTLIISLPHCHAFDLGVDWFTDSYKHAKPNEHLHHFNASGLSLTLGNYGWVPVGWPSNHEDIIRKSAHGLPNILTMAFVRK